MDSISQLQDAVEKLMQSAILVESRSRREAATIMATRSIVTEVALRIGAEPAQINQLYEDRINYYHDKIVQSFGNQDSELAALLDGRSISEVPVVSGFPPIFPPKPE